LAARLAQDQAVAAQRLNAMEKTNGQALIVFQKNPVLGKVKTRLAATLGKEKALEIYHYLLKKTYFQINKIEETTIFVYYSDYLEEPAARLSSVKIRHQVQQGDDLGERMKNAFKEVFSEGFNKIAIIGTDCPDISTSIIREAFAKLASFPIVFGPAKDGGYYLLGMNRIENSLFEEIPWSTSAVLKISAERLKEKNIPYQLLPMLSDIDNEEDWNAYKRLIPNTNE